MARPAGTQLPTRVRDLWIEDIQAQFEDKSDEQLRLLQSAIAHELARRVGFRKTKSGSYTDEELIAHLVDTDARVFTTTGKRLTTGTEYNAHRAPGAPAVATYYRHFGKPFARALLEAGLSDGPQAVSVVIKLTGRAAGGRTFSRDECVTFLADAREYFARFGTTRVSQTDYDLVYRAVRRPGRVSEVPAAQTICAHSTLAGKGGSWDEMHARSDERILSNRDLHPFAYAQLTRGADLDVG